MIALDSPLGRRRLDLSGFEPSLELDDEEGREEGRWISSAAASKPMIAAATIPAARFCTFRVI